MTIDSALWRNPEDAEFARQRPIIRRPLGTRALEGAGAREATIGIVDSATGFTLTVVPELYKGVRRFGGFSSLEPAFIALRNDVLADPFGANNVDQHLRSKNGQQARIVQRIPESSPLNELIPGVPLAVKTSGLAAEEANRQLEEAGRQARSSATEQFQQAFTFQQLQEKYAPEGFFGLIRPVRVYGAVREAQDKTAAQPPREWLLMEHVPVNRHVRDRTAVGADGHLYSGFSPYEYPELGALVTDTVSPYSKPCAYEDLAQAIATQYPWAEPFLGDFGGENLLEVLKPRDENGVVKKEYVIIDPELRKET